MNKKKIAILSTIKPIDDVRSYHKIGISLSKIEDVSVHLIGPLYPSSILPDGSSNIYSDPIEVSGMTPLKRIVLPFKILRKLFKLKPQLIIINSYELLIVIFIHQILFGGKIVYDVQENYWRNLIYQNNYPPIVKHLLAVLIRLKEKSFSPFISHFLLAEKCYTEELSFIGNKYTLLENKALSNTSSKESSQDTSGLNIIFSGNISENSGVLRAINIYKQLIPFLADSKMLIIGHCPSRVLMKRLKDMDEDSIDLQINETPLPYSLIQNALRKSHIGIVSYNLNPSNEGSIPTKIFEYLYHGLYIISESNTNWSKMITGNQQGVDINFDDFNAEALAAQLKNSPSQTEIKNEEFDWSTEEKKLIPIIESLL